jgi:hypothetical protein
MKTTTAKKTSFEDAIPKPQGIYHKLWKAKQEIGKVAKGKDNPFFKSKYADLNALLEATEPILLKYDLIVLQPIIDGQVCTRIIDIENGDFVESSLMLPVVSDPQKQIAGVTYFRRATLQSLLSLQAIDDDGNTVSEAVKNTKPSITEDRFQNGLKQVDAGDMTKEEFKKILSKFQLTESQTKTIALL